MGFPNNAPDHWFHADGGDVEPPAFDVMSLATVRPGGGLRCVVTYANRLTGEQWEVTCDDPRFVELLGYECFCS